MYNKELLVKGNRLSTQELADILNPIKQEDIDKYDRILNLEGLFKDINDYFEKFIAYLQTGNSAQYDKSFQIIEETVTVKRYHKKVPSMTIKDVNNNLELEQTSDNEIWIDCSADDEGAVSYDYSFTRQKLVEKPDNTVLALAQLFNKLDTIKTGKSANNLLSAGLELPENLKALNYININDTIENINQLREVFVDNQQFSNRVCLMFINSVLNSLQETINKLKKSYQEGSIVNIKQFIALLPSLRANWKACYDAYEKAKNLGFSGYKKANLDDLDRGFSLSYKDLMNKYGIKV